MREYLKNTVGRIFWAFLCITMLTATLIIALLPVTDIPVQAGTKKAIRLVNGGTDTGISKWNHIYFGTMPSTGYVYKENDNSSDPYWKVIDRAKDNAGGDNAMFVIAESLWGTDNEDEYGNVIFDTYTNSWQGSYAQTWCQYFYRDVFSGDDDASLEKSAIRSVSKLDDFYTTETFWKDYGTSTLNNEKVFFLSAEEAENYLRQPEDWVLD